MKEQIMKDSFKTFSSININNKDYSFFNITKLNNSKNLPFSIKILLENLLRFEDGTTVSKNDINSILAYDKSVKENKEISFHPSRVIMQDFTGVPAVVDLAAMRDAIKKLGGDPEKINPLLPVDLVIDHSVQVDSFGENESLNTNLDYEYKRNFERYAFLKWGQNSFSNFNVVPPATGIIHQVNIEYLGKIVFEKNNSLYPDTLVGTDSHTTMINGAGILGWGVGGIESEAAILGQPITMLVPEVIGLKLHGVLKEGLSATDLVLTITKILRKENVVGKFVEFFGTGLDNVALPDRATISNMSPEFGSTCAIFPVDEQTIKYLILTGRNKNQIKIIEEYTKAQGLFRTGNEEPANYTKIIELDLSKVQPCISGPSKPQEKIILSKSKQSFNNTLSELKTKIGSRDDIKQNIKVSGSDFSLNDGSVVIAAITSCTNTSNPSVMIGAGLLAKNAISKGLKSKPWVKTSFAPGSKVVSQYLLKAELQSYLNKLGFNIVGYGCTTCIGNSGPISDEIEKTITTNNIYVCSVLSGNRNFEGRIHPAVRMNYLASPLLVVSYALAGTMDINFKTTPLGMDFNNEPVFLKDIWPKTNEIKNLVKTNVTEEQFKNIYSDVFKGDSKWNKMESKKTKLYNWDQSSTYVKNPPYFDNMKLEKDIKENIVNARVLALLGDSITTDHISPAGAIKENSPAGEYLINNGVSPSNFNSYGSRRGNHEVMIRGTLANVRLRNKLAPGTEGGFTTYLPTNEQMSIFDASKKYLETKTPLIILAGKHFGSGSSRDWAAKGQRLLGVKAVIAESFERIHRSNLIGMGIIPLMFKNEDNIQSLGLTGLEIYNISGLNNLPRDEITVKAVCDDKTIEFKVIPRIDTPKELDYFKNDGILNYVLRKLL